MHPYERLFAALRPHRGTFSLDGAGQLRETGIDRRCPIEVACGRFDNTLAFEHAVTCFGMTKEQAVATIDAADGTLYNYTDPEDGYLVSSGHFDLQCKLTQCCLGGPYEVA